MKRFLILLSAIVVSLSTRLGHASPTKPLFSQVISKPLYFAPRVFVFKPRRIRLFHLSESTFGAIGFVPQHLFVSPPALMNWKHVNSFSVQPPQDTLTINYRRWSGSSEEYWQGLRIARYQDRLGSSYLNRKIIIGTKFVVSEFAESQFPTVFLHQPAPTMKHALEMQPPPLVTTFAHY